MDNLASDLARLTKLKSGVERLTLTDYRNYSSLRIEANGGPIVVFGENGSGKTNILEAVSFLSPGRGLRGAKLADIKRFIPQITPQGGIAFVTPLRWAVAAEIVNNGDAHTLATAVEKSTKEIEDAEGNRSFERRIVMINGNKSSLQSDLGKYISTIWLTPQMDRLFRGGSQPRRAFLDRMVYAFDNDHAKRVADFEHLYRERYRLIKDNKIDNYWLESLEEKMAGLGVAIAAARREQIARLNAFIEREPDDVFPSVQIELQGRIEKELDDHPAVMVEEIYKDILRSQRKILPDGAEKDGVNHTDFKVYHKKKCMPAEMCSTGEQKSLLVSIILAQAKCQTLHKGFAPVVLLDEVAAHLDDTKREALLKKIVDLNFQAWITTTNPELFEVIKSSSQFIEVKHNHATTV
ncbi:MAG: DNA replication/repair protein RecF [Alphaproteobacteria bacterium]|nr:DNA replication/repair protein RecF [Alphaproteobacteria bacterium]